MKKRNNNHESYKSRTIPRIYWAATVFLAFIMFFGGIAEILNQWGTLETHTILGYPVYVLTIIGMWKIFGTFAILVPKFPRLKEWAYAGMFFDITGAFISHAAVGNYGSGAYHLITTGLIAGIVLISWALRPGSRSLRTFSMQTFNNSLKSNNRKMDIELPAVDTNIEFSVVHRSAR